jgi:CheY-like chemotaxis protein
MKAMTFMAPSHSGHFRGSISTPAAVLVDIGLPDMDGYELARRLRDLRLQPPPLIVALSGHAPREERASLFGEYLVKPVDFRRLRSIIARTRATPARS